MLRADATNDTRSMNTYAETPTGIKRLFDPIAYQKCNIELFVIYSNVSIKYLSHFSLNYSWFSYSYVFARAWRTNFQKRT